MTDGLSLSQKRRYGDMMLTQPEVHQSGCSHILYISIWIPFHAVIPNRPSWNSQNGAPYSLPLPSSLFGSVYPIA